ncbi:MAG: hypothetical protein FWG50_14240 [Kiritimatiellaeota bacterium]|nr:hypothetical protein [Kiritimatiellota bacterium]
MKRLTAFVVLMSFACYADEKADMERIVRASTNDNITVFFLPPSWLVPPSTNRATDSSWLVPPLTNRTYSVKDFELRTQGVQTELALPPAADGTRETYLFEGGKVTGVRLDGGGTNETLMFSDSAIFKLVPEPVRPAFLLQTATNSIAQELLGFVAGADADREITMCVKQIDGLDALDIAFPNGIYWRFLFGRPIVEILPRDRGVAIRRYNGPPRTSIASSIFCLIRKNYRIAASPGKRRGQIEFIGDKKLDIIFDYDRDCGKDGWSVLVTDYEADMIKAFDFSGTFIKSRTLSTARYKSGNPFED